MSTTCKRCSSINVVIIYYSCYHHHFSYMTQIVFFTHLPLHPIISLYCLMNITINRVMFGSLFIYFNILSINIISFLVHFFLYCRHQSLGILSVTKFSIFTILNGITFPVLVLHPPWNTFKKHFFVLISHILITVSFMNPSKIT